MLITNIDKQTQLFLEKIPIDRL